MQKDIKKGLSQQIGFEKDYLISYHRGFKKMDYASDGFERMYISANHSF
jgi:hypothetical protein